MKKEEIKMIKNNKKSVHCLLLMHNFAIFLFSLFIILFSFSCAVEGSLADLRAKLDNGGVIPEGSFSVDFHADGGTPAPSRQIIEKDGKVTEPPEMKQDGYIFGGWFRDEGFLEEWDFENDTVTKHIILYAKWTPIIPVYSITISQTSAHIFPDEYQHYPAIEPLTVTITNTGNTATGNLSIILSDGEDSFVLSKEIINIPKDGTDTFTVKPANGLEGGTYSGTVTVTGDNINDESFSVSFKVTGATLFVINNTSDWNTRSSYIAQSGGDGEVNNPKIYILEINGDISINGCISSEYTLGYYRSHIIGILRGNGKLYLSRRANLLKIKSNHTIIIDSEDLILEGRKLGFNNSSENNNLAVIAVEGGILELKNGTIRNNYNINLNDGGGVSLYSGTFNMSGGKIINNISNNNDSTNGNRARGGGVFIQGGTFNMTDGEISGNESGDGGGVYINSGTFYFSGGDICNNNAQGSNTQTNAGGGVYVNNNSKFFMSGGKISGNGADSGGGVYVYGNYTGANVDLNGTFTMTGGEIFGNETWWGNGGGVIIVTYGRFYKTKGDGVGGIIYGKNEGENSNICRRTETIEGEEVTVERNGFAVYWSRSNLDGGSLWRNITLGRNDDISTNVTSIPPWD